MAQHVDLELKGLERLQARLAAYAKQIPDICASALYEEAEIMMTESKKRCPVAPDGGTLRSSGHVEDPVVRGNDISVVLAYGGPAITYALAVHEHPSKHSPPSWQGKEEINWNVPGTGPKFLQSVILEGKPRMASQLATRIREKLRNR